MKIQMLRYLLGLGVLVLAGGMVFGQIKEEGGVQSQSLLSPDKEIELALKAAPVHLRKDASVYVFGKRGYEKSRTGTNGFNSEISRRRLPH